MESSLKEDLSDAQLQHDKAVKAEPVVKFGTSTGVVITHMSGNLAMTRRLFRMKGRMRMISQVCYNALGTYTC
jgi:hypothetical protein